MTEEQEALLNQIHQTYRYLSRRSATDRVELVIYAGAREYAALRSLPMLQFYSSEEAGLERVAGFPIVKVARDQFFHVAPAW